jgi:demethylmenaquinone methyltransferase / 2-methoxy-6-polyprenyl-1,4-benzoquinol methylase
MTTPSRQDAWKMFDLISPTYDKINRILSLGMDQKWRRRVIEKLPPRKELEILDIATGTGEQISAMLDSHASIRSVVGVDLSSEMMEIAKQKIGAKVQFLRADAQELPFEENTFDAATFSFGIRNVVNPLRSLESIYRVLKPEGRCLILEFSLPSLPFRPFYLFYLRYLLPRIGGFLSKEPAAYKYLNQTIETFPYGESFCSLMADAGFKNVTQTKMALGGVSLYCGEKG